MPQLNSAIISTGSYLPKQFVTNDDLAQKIETSDEWIRTRTGIEGRHYGDETETTTFMATKAAERALEQANLTAEDIDMIVVATVTPDYTFPSVACLMQKQMGLTNASVAFDVQAACSGFVYGLNLIDAQIKTGQVKRAILVGVEKFSSILNWEDRSTCVLFGDGAGAVVIEATDNPNRGVIASKLHANGNLADLLHGTGGIAATQTAGHVSMQGREVFRHAVREMVGVVGPLLEKNNLKTDDIDWLIPHQANMRIIEAVTKQLDFPMEKTIQTVATHANTSAASIPLALDDANRKGTFKQGDLLALSAFGAGFTWAGALLRW